MPYYKKNENENMVSYACFIVLCLDANSSLHHIFQQIDGRHSKDSSYKEVESCTGWDLTTKDARDERIKAKKRRQT